MSRRGGAAWLGIALAGAAFGFLFFGERRRPLRRARHPGPRRLATNAAIAAVSAAVLQVADRPYTRPAARRVARRRQGLVHLLPLPRWARTAAAVLLLDYTLWVWHVLLHHWGPLWKVHAFHHADEDLDVTTAIRFHPGELVASVPWRLLQVRLIGAGPGALAAWQAALFLSVLFHHSNLRLPLELERALASVFVTPRQHGIHHSVVIPETDSNFSSLLNLWDRLHGTLRLDVPQEAITIGLPEVPERAAIFGPAGQLQP